jgi:predicted NBD/HSP70 family sugar kinase
MTMAQPAGQQTVRRHNLGLVLEQIAAGHGRSRAQIAHATGLTRTTVSALVDELVSGRLVTELAPDRGSRGRPASPLVLNPGGPAGLGIEVNVDYISACVVDLTGAVRARRTALTDNRLSTPRAALRRAITLAGQVRAESDLPIAGVMLALPGLVDGNGVLQRAPNLPRWDGVAGAPVLAEALGVPVTVDNEANLAALAELWFGDAPGDFLLVSGEIGVGAGTVLGGQLFRGTRGLAGELGHVVVDPTGRICGCGARGCLEQVAGQEALVRNAELAGAISTSTAEPDGAVAQLAALAAAGDPRVLQVLSEAGAALGVALSAAINMLDVPAVVLGGIYARLGEWLTASISVELDSRVTSRRWETLDLRLSALGTDAAVRGAAGSIVKRVLAAAGPVGAP